MYRHGAANGARRRASGSGDARLSAATRASGSQLRARVRDTGLTARVKNLGLHIECRPYTVRRGRVVNHSHPPSPYFPPHRRPRLMVGPLACFHLHGRRSRRHRVAKRWSLNSPASGCASTDSRTLSGPRLSGELPWVADAVRPSGCLPGGLASVLPAVSGHRVNWLGGGARLGVAGSRRGLGLPRVARWPARSMGVAQGCGAPWAPSAGGARWGVTSGGAGPSRRFPLPPRG